MAVQDNKSINTSYGAPPINLIGTTENRSTAGCNGMMERNMLSECFSFSTSSGWYNDKRLDGPVVFQPTPGLGYKGNWNHVEAYYQINSIVNGVGQADGVMQYWFNGTLVIDRHDILFRTGARPSINFHQFLIAPYIGDGSAGISTCGSTISRWRRAGRSRLSLRRREQSSRRPITESHYGNDRLRSCAVGHAVGVRLNHAELHAREPVYA